MAAKVDRESFVKPLNEPKQNATKPGSLRRVAERVGVTAPAILNAQKQVAAIEKYPGLKEIIHTQKDVLTVSKNLDKFPEDERKKAQKPLR